MSIEPDEGGGFLSRWSRRKHEAREHDAGGRQAEDVTGEVPPATTGTPPSHDASAPDLPVTQDASDTPPSSPDTGEGQRDGAARLPTLDDVGKVLPDGDFSSFMARDVPTDVRNAAMKKLFSDPHYNVMDGLDTYIDDYSQMEAMPANMLGRIVSSRVLNLVSDDQPQAGSTPTEAVDNKDDPQVAQDSSMVESAPSGVAPSTTPRAANPADQAGVSSTPSQSVDTHADTDLQLQPDDAARRGPSGHRT